MTPLPAPLSAARPPGHLLGAVAVISAAVLGYEVALTRVFAVLLRYHFAFLVISVALCGLGVGGYAAHWLRRRRPLPLPLLAVVFAVCIDASLLLMLRGLFPLFPELYAVAAILVLVPFAVAGAFLAEVFARFPQWSGRLYAWDLGGAALAAVGVVGLLQTMSAIDACLAIATLAAVAALWLPSETERRASLKPRRVVVAPLLLAALWMSNLRLHWLDIPALPPHLDANESSLSDRGLTQPLFTELGTPGHTSRIVETRWNAFARTDVVQDSIEPDTRLIYTNGNVPTNMMQWNGDMKAVGVIAQQFRLSDWAFAVAPLRGPQAAGRVLAIGPGGGLDALLALHHGAREFDGAEINPSIVDLMREWKKFNGGIYEKPGVRVVTAEGRAFVREAIVKGRRYNVLFSALTKTATAGQGTALLESYIYTTDAFRDYLNALDANGQFVLVLDQPLLLARFFATTLSVLRERGMNEQTACRHIAMIYDPRPGPYQYAFVVRKAAFSRAQTYDLMDAALHRHLTPIWIPLQAANNGFGPYPAVASGQMSLDGFVQVFRELDTPLNIEPLPDDRPFVLDLTLAPLPVFKQMAVVALLLAVGLALAGWRSASATRSELGEDAPLPQRSLGASEALYLAYFLALGVGFMLVEIPLAQKLILPLGYPTLALTVILFSILLGGGAGSWFSQRLEGAVLERWAIACALMVALVTAASTFFLDRSQNALLGLDLPLRCAVTVLLLLPLGFLLGTPFPSGLRVFARSHASQVPLVWGLNGVASVIGSLCAAMGAKSFGFNAVLSGGALIYLLAALLLLLISRVAQSGAGTAEAVPPAVDVA